jgi:hypothetical protein
MPAFRRDHGAYHGTGRRENNGAGNEQSPPDAARLDRLALQCCASGAGKLGTG